MKSVTNVTNMKIGDKCRLTSGGPVMTVLGDNGPLPENFVRVGWFNSAGGSYEFKDEVLHKDSLMEWPPKEEK